MMIAANIAAGGGTAPSFVKSASGSAFATSVTATFTGNVTAGNVIAGAVGVDTSGITFLVTDNCNTSGTSNTYTIADSAQGTGRTSTFYATIGATTASCAVSVTYSGSGSRGYVLAVHEITASTLDAHTMTLNGFGNYDTANSITSGNATASVAATYVFGSAFDTESRGSTLTAGTNYGLRVSITGGGGGTGDNLFTEDLQTSSSGALPATFQRTASCAGNCRFGTGIMIFKP